MHYIRKILSFIDSHYRIGELYMEYIKEGCLEKGEKCEKCKDGQWLGPKFERVPAPFPDPENPGHYKGVFDTPKVDKDGQLRAVDDYAPRANLKQLFKDGSISSNDKKAVEDVCRRLCINEREAVEYVRHLEELKVLAKMRENERQNKQKEADRKTYDDYNWYTLITSNTLKTLKVKELNKYLVNHQLPQTGKKDDKLRRIVSDFYIRTGTREEPVADESDESEVEEALSSDSEGSESEEDEVLAVIDDFSGSEETYDEEALSDTEVLSRLTTSRQGHKRKTNAPSRFGDFFLF